MNMLSTLIGMLSEDVKLYMELLTASRHYALNNRTIHFLSQGEVDMSATTGVTFGLGSGAAANNVGDAGIEELLDIETEVEMFVADNNKTKAGGALFKYFNLTNSDLAKYGLSNNTDGTNYQHNCLCLALKAGGLSYIELQHAILTTLRNRAIHKCDLTNVCNALEINIELCSLKDEAGNSRVEHYPSPYIDFQGNII